MLREGGPSSGLLSPARQPRVMGLFLWWLSEMLRLQESLPVDEISQMPTRTRERAVVQRDGSDALRAGAVRHASVAASPSPATLRLLIGQFWPMRPSVIGCHKATRRHKKFSVQRVARGGADALVEAVIGLFAPL